jgi:hypothetical protein
VTTPRGPQSRNSKTTATDPKLDSVSRFATALLCEQGLVKALKRARSELRHARRARSRKLYGFWAAVEAKLDAARLDGERTAAAVHSAVVAETPRAPAASPVFAPVDLRGEPKGAPAPRTAAGDVWTSIVRSP